MNSLNLLISELDDEAMVNTSTAALVVGLRPGTLEKLRTHGGGPEFVKYARAVRYCVGVLRAWKLKNTTASTSEHWRAA